MTPTFGSRRGRPHFEDRAAAGRALADLLAERALPTDLLVLGLPRGGVVVAAEVARALHRPLEAWAVRKVGAPDHPELALGAVASGGAIVVHPDVVAWLGVAQDRLARLVASAQQDLEAQEGLWRPPERSRLDPGGRPVLVVDDGFATGATAEAAVLAARSAGCRTVVLAAPVAASDTVRALAEIADEVVVCATPEPFGSVGRWYTDFRQTSNREVSDLLRSAAD